MATDNNIDYTISSILNSFEVWFVFFISGCDDNDVNPEMRRAH